MINDILVSALLIILFSTLGAGLLFLTTDFTFSLKKKTLFASSFLIGVSFFTLASFLSYITLAVPFTLLTMSTLYILIMVLIIFLSILFKRKQLQNASSDLLTLSFPAIKINEISLISLIILIPILLSITFNLYWPINDWDSLALYDFRGRVFALTGEMDSAISSGYFWGYPLLTSLLHTTHYVMRGDNPSVFYSFFYISLLIIFYDLLSLRIQKKPALIWTIVLALSFPIFRHSFMSYTNLPYTTYFATSVLCLFEWIRKKNNAMLILSSFLLGGSVWTRNAEPFWIIGLLLVVLYGFKKNQFQFILFYFINFFLYLFPWAYFKKANLDAPALIKPAHSVIGLVLVNFSIGNVGEVVAYLFQFVVKDKIELIILFIFLSSILIKNNLFKKRDYFPQLLTISLIFIILFVGTYYFSLQFEGWISIGGSVQRMSMMLLPLLLFFSANVYHKVLLKKAE